MRKSICLVLPDGSRLCGIQSRQDHHTLTHTRIAAINCYFDCDFTCYLILFPPSIYSVIAILGNQSPPLEITVSPLPISCRVHIDETRGTNPRLPCLCQARSLEGRGQIRDCFPFPTRGSCFTSPPLEVAFRPTLSILFVVFMLIETRGTNPRLHCLRQARWLDQFRTDAEVLFCQVVDLMRFCWMGR